MRQGRENIESESILMVDDDIEGECDYNDDIDNDDDDKASISSESTCSSEMKKDTLVLQKNIQEQSADLEIWRLFQVDDQNMKDIPNSDVILNILTACNLNGIYM